MSPTYRLANGEDYTVPPRIDFCVAGQISEDADRIELLKGGLVSQPPAFRDLWTGINMMASGINLGKVFVFEGACPGFVDEVKEYSRPVDEMGNVDLDADPEEKKFHWLDGFRYYSSHRLVDVKTAIAVHGGGEATERAIDSAQGVIGMAYGRARSRVSNMLVSAGMRFLP